MAADASIYAQFRQPVKSVADYMAERDQQEGNALKLAAARMDMQKAQQADADTQAIRGLARQHGGDTNALVKALYGGGYLTQAQGLEKSIADSLKARTDQQKTAQEIESKRLEDAKRRVELSGQVFGFVKDNPTLENAIRAADFLGQNGILPPERVQATIADLQANPDPERIRGLATQAFQSALDAKEQLPKFFQQNRGGTVATLGVNPVTGVSTDAQVATVTQTPDSIARSEDAAKSRAQALQIAGMVDARAREGLKLQGERLAFDKTKAEDKPLNDTQSKALLFGSRMRESNTVLSELEKAGTTTSFPGARAGYGIGATVNAISSAQQQQLEQAKRDFVNAVLRRESGAVIADSEFANAEKQYFPQIGDSKEVIKQKARNRQLAIDGILAEVPEGKRDSLKRTPQMPTADDIRRQADNILRGG